MARSSTEQGCAPRTSVVRGRLCCCRRAAHVVCVSLALERGISIGELLIRGWSDCESHKRAPGWQCGTVQHNKTILGHNPVTSFGPVGGGGEVDEEEVNVFQQVLVLIVPAKEVGKRQQEGLNSRHQRHLSTLAKPFLTSWGPLKAASGSIAHCCT